MIPQQVCVCFFCLFSFWKSTRFFFVFCFVLFLAVSLVPSEINTASKVCVFMFFWHIIDCGFCIDLCLPIFVVGLSLLKTGSEEVYSHLLKQFKEAVYRHPQLYDTTYFLAAEQEGNRA